MTQSCQCSFDLECLRQLAHGDDGLLQNLLKTLQEDLECEIRAINQDAVNPDEKKISASLHRLKGIACLIDAGPLAQAALALSEQHGKDRARHVHLLWVMANLGDDIERARSATGSDL